MNSPVACCTALHFRPRMLTVTKRPLGRRWQILNGNWHVLRCSVPAMVDRIPKDRHWVETVFGFVPELPRHHRLFG